VADDRFGRIRPLRSGVVGAHEENQPMG
jgi:hypothetical protein